MKIERFFFKFLTIELIFVSMIRFVLGREF